MCLEWGPRHLKLGQEMLDFPDVLAKHLPLCPQIHHQTHLSHPSTPSTCWPYQHLYHICLLCGSIDNASWEADTMIRAAFGFTQHCGITSTTWILSSGLGSLPAENDFNSSICWNGISWDVILTWNWTFRQGIVSDHCAVKTCANDIILTVDW